MISKELLSEVLGVGVKTVISSEANVTYNLYQNPHDFDTINLYELAHMCKLHFLDDYTIHSFYDHCGTAFAKVSSGTGAKLPKKMFHKATEPEVIFEACEWIHNQNNICRSGKEGNK